MRQLLLPAVKRVRQAPRSPIQELDSPCCEQGLPCSPGGCDMCTGARHRLAQDLSSRSGAGSIESDPVQIVLFH
jgi:hypothetical protein